jgi:hypothetical protein
MILFSLNPAFDMLPASENLDDLFREKYDENLRGIAPEREELYQTCERQGVGINVMKTYAGGRLFNADQSPFGVALSPVQCIHYALTRPAVAAVMLGYHAPETCRCRRGIRERFGGSERLCQCSGFGTSPLVFRPMHLLRPLLALSGPYQYRRGQQTIRSRGHAADRPAKRPCPL